MDAVKDNEPQIYMFALASHSCESKLAFGHYTILSREGSQQEDPLGVVEYRDAEQPTILKSKSETNWATCMTSS